MDNITPDDLPDEYQGLSDEDEFKADAYCDTCGRPCQDGEYVTNFGGVWCDECYRKEMEQEMAMAMVDYIPRSERTCEYCGEACKIGEYETVDGVGVVCARCSPCHPDFDRMRYDR